MHLTPLQGFILIGIGVEAMFAQANFSSTITLGSVILAVVVLAVAGFFTIRSNIAQTWKSNYEAEVVKREQAETALHDFKEQMIAEREVQANLRHELKDDKAALTLELELEKRKPDLSAIVDMATEHYSTAMREVTSMFEGVTRTQTQMLSVLSRLADHLERNDAKGTS